MQTSSSYPETVYAPTRITQYTHTPIVLLQGLHSINPYINTICYRLHTRGCIRRFRSAGCCLGQRDTGGLQSVLLLLSLRDCELYDFQLPRGNEFSMAGPGYESSYLPFQAICASQTMLTCSVLVC